MLIFMYIMCSIDFQDKSLNRLSPLDSIISPWPTTGRLSHSRKSLLSLYPSIYLSISSIIFLSGYFLVILSIYHTFIFQSSYFTYLFISSGNFKRLWNFQKKNKNKPTLLSFYTDFFFLKEPRGQMHWFTSRLKKGNDVD